MSSEENLIDPTKKDEYVPAVFAHSQKEADMYHQLLLDHEIESIVGYKDTECPEDAIEGMTHGLPVLVLESYLDEASEIIADRDDQDEFEEDEFENDEDEDEFDDFSPASEDELNKEVEDEYSGNNNMDFLDNLDEDPDEDL